MFESSIFFSKKEVSLLHTQQPEHLLCHSELYLHGLPRIDARSVLNMIDLSMEQTEEMLRLLRVEQGHLLSPGEFDKFWNPQFGG